MAGGGGAVALSKYVYVVCVRFAAALTIVAAAANDISCLRRLNVDD